MGNLRKSLSGWGRYPKQECITWRPEKYRELYLPEGNMIARGLGRSYGDAALNIDGNVVLTERVNRFLELDSHSGILRAEAGVSLAEIIDVCLPRGWFLPVTPGTRHASLGGCIAADVHGKNHHRIGAFSSSVECFSLITADGSSLICSRDDNADIFWATVGGMGLTGIIGEVTLKLRPVKTAYMEARHIKTANLEKAFSALAEDNENDEYTVAWIDCLARGRHLGRSIVMQGAHAGIDSLKKSQQSLPLMPWPRRHYTLPFDLPAWWLNPLSISLFNALYYRLAGRKQRPFITNLDSYFYPLDTISHWNRMYGKRGFVQYQCVIPESHAYDGIRQILERIADSRLSSFLAVLKRLGPESGGLLSFPMPGYTLALDLPVQGRNLFTLLNELDKLVAKSGGRVYLAKDARMDKELFADMYPQLKTWREIKQRIDPDNHFTSSMARRLGLVAP